MCISIIVLVGLGVVSSDSTDVGPLVRALWLVQARGIAEAVVPSGDQRLKGRLAKALAKDQMITRGEIEGLMTPETFGELAGSDSVLDSSEIASALAAVTSASRARLFPSLRSHADYLTTTFDQIDEAHRQAGDKITRWMVANHRPGEPLDLIVVCTGNSRRSLLGAAMGNLAAAYYGMPEIRFHSGGTAPSAFNPRAIAALKDVGFEVKPTGEQAPRGEPALANPIYRVRWGEGFETVEFSKHYHDKANPQTAFAALMVCGEADASCPLVKGAATRVSMPYLDPRIFDDSAYEGAKYAERRDDMGRLMLATLMRTRLELRVGQSSAR